MVPGNPRLDFFALRNADLAKLGKITRRVSRAERLLGRRESEPFPFLVRKLDKKERQQELT